MTIILIDMIEVEMLNIILMEVKYKKKTIMEKIVIVSNVNQIKKE